MTPPLPRSHLPEKANDSHQHLTLPSPTTSPGGLCYVTVRGGQVGAGHVTQGTSNIRWLVRGTPTSIITPNLQCQEETNTRPEGPLDRQGLNLKDFIGAS